MKLASLEHFGVSLRRALALACGSAVGAAVVTGLVVGDSLGQAKAPTTVLVGALVFYIVLSTPRRLLDGERVAQARESPLLAASAAAALTVTGSRTRTLVLLRSKDPALGSALAESGRRVLLGERIERALAISSKGLASYSAGAALGALATFEPRAMDLGDEEARGLDSASEIRSDTRTPALTTVCFFAPILLTLYAVLSHSYDPSKLAELAAFEFIVVDLALYLSASDGGAR